MESTVRDHPDDPWFVSWLGMVYADLGRKEEALRESQRAVDLVPANDAIERPHYLSNLSLVYALTGETEKAVTLVEQLLTTPTAESMAFHAITFTQLRSWRWDSLQAIRASRKFSQARSRRRCTRHDYARRYRGGARLP